MNPSSVASSLRDIADRLDRSKRPSLKAVASELKRVLTAATGTQVVVSELWGTEEEARAAAQECGAVTIGQGPYGEWGMEVPSANLEQCLASIPGDGTLEERLTHVFESWDEVSEGDPDFAFEIQPA